MTNRRIIKHMAFAVIGAAVVAEILAVSAIAASMDSDAGLWTAAPLHQLHFNAIAAYNSAIDYAGHLLATLNVTSLGTAAETWAADLLTFKFQLNGSELEIAVFGR